jgi:hypothetical protein
MFFCPFEFDVLLGKCSEWCQKMGAVRDHCFIMISMPTKDRTCFTLRGGAT